MSLLCPRKPCSLYTQVLQANPKAKILLCAPSNTATDESFSRVVKLLGARALPGGDCRAFRANAVFRKVDEATPACCKDPPYTRRFAMGSMFEFALDYTAFRVVAATLTTASKITGT